MTATDLHSHILPAVDDGPTTLEGSVSLARACLTAGTRRVVATPHVNHRWGVHIDDIRESHTALIDSLRQQSIELTLEFGGELELSTALNLSTEQLDWFRLGGGDWLLIEPPPYGPTLSVHSMIFEIQARGYRILLAHPERCRTFQEHPELLESLVAGGIRTQITAGAITGGFGHTAKRTSREFFKRKIVHTVASDAHDAERRPPDLTNELTRTGYKDMIRWLCHDMPAWILDGGDEPPRPDAGTAGRWRSLLRR